ncbi:MAG TPA: SRPBCC family protein [Pyrinomonadaceae bacterium]|nr:SRPBCC family protein [Pyrinomonadaceae bacterium]
MSAESRKQVEPETGNDDYGVVTEPRTVRLERLLPGPIERVWAYLTESEKRGKWFASGPMELRAGGKLEFHFHNSQLASEGGPPPERFKDCEGMVSTGYVVRCEPPHVLSFMWGEEQGDESEVIFELTPKGDQVLMVLTHRNLRNRQELVSVASGWHVHVGVLIDQLNGRQTKEFWAKVDQMEAEYEKRVPAEI